MKLFQINVIANSGSTGRIAESVAEIMMAKSWTCYTAYGRWANPSKTILYKIGSKWSIYYHYFLSRFYGKHGLASIGPTKRLINKIRSVKPDLIHIHNIHGYYINYPLLFQYLSNIDIPVVWTLHDCWAYTGHCAHYTNVKCYQWMNVCLHCPNLKDYPSSFNDYSKESFELKKYYFTRVKNLTIVPVSRWLEKEVKSSFLAKYPTRVIHNGVDTILFTPTNSDIKWKYGIDDKFMILGVASQWNERKGLTDFLKLGKLLSDDEIIFLVGLNNKQISSLPSNIIGIQKTEDISELVNLYSCADIFINFSIEETFGLTTAESMACGTPVLVYNSTACPEIVTKDTGFVVEPHDILGAMDVVRHIKKVGKMNYSVNCTLHIGRYFEQKEKYKEYADLYEELLLKTSAYSK